MEEFYYFDREDALSPCFRLENVCFRRRSFLKRLFERFSNCFFCEVAYSDGLVSRLVEDRYGRTPVGIVWNGWLILGKEAPQKMTWSEGLKFCAAIKVQGKGCQMCPRSERGSLYDYYEQINQLLCDLELEPFQGADYFCQDLNNLSVAYCLKGSYYMSVELRIRPMVRLF